MRERAGTRQPKPGPEGGRLAESGSFESCGHYRKGGTHARIERCRMHALESRSGDEGAVLVADIRGFRVVDCDPRR